MKKYLIVILLFISQSMNADFCTFMQEWGKAFMPEYWYGSLVMPQRSTKQKYTLIKSTHGPLEQVTITWYRFDGYEKKMYSNTVWLNEQGRACESNGQFIVHEYNDGKRVDRYDAIPPYELVGGQRCSVKMDKKIVTVKYSNNTEYRGNFDSEGKLFCIDDNNQLIPDENGVSFVERAPGDPGAWTKKVIFNVMYDDATIDGTWAQTVRTWKLKYCEKTWCAAWAIGLIAVTYGIIKAGRTLHAKYKNQQEIASNV